ncbi:MAG: peptidase M22, partial [Clostridia bacterium]|nr:peptidase M22 [Clostridia bacterium]
NILSQAKVPLPVKEGECGLRQSDALFAHIKNLPLLAASVREMLSGDVPLAVGVSEKPRNQKNSYMPCFLAGVSAAESIGAALGIPVCRFSHQCGHIRAALYSSGQSVLRETAFGAFHISGGTTETLLCTPAENGFHAEIVGGTADLHAGQLIDRVGVMLGLPFPCGPALETLARENRKPIPKRKVKTENGFLHLSGFENLARKLYEDTRDKALTAAYVQYLLAEGVTAMSRDFRSAYPGEAGEPVPLVYAGGVMSNGYIREWVQRRLDNTFFAAPVFSADNAAGIALLTAETLLKRQNRS